MMDSHDASDVNSEAFEKLQIVEINKTRIVTLKYGGSPLIDSSLSACLRLRVFILCPGLTYIYLLLFLFIHGCFPRNIYLCPFIPCKQLHDKFMVNKSNITNLWGVFF